jgi:hypothetical protein
LGQVKIKTGSITYLALSKWNKAPNAFSDKYDQRGEGICLPFAKPKEKPPTDYDNLGNLNEFPALIAKAKVCKILHLGAGNACDTKYRELIDPNGKYKLETSPNPDYLKKSSLMKFLGLEKPKDPKATATP